MSSINFNTSSSQSGFLSPANSQQDSQPTEMAQRKSRALARLDELDAITARQINPVETLSTHFTCHTKLAEFDLDSLLSRYQTEAHPSGLIVYINRTGVQDDSSDWESFEAERQKMKTDGELSFPEDSVWKRFDNIATRQGSDQERRQYFEELRQQFFQNAIDEYSNENPDILQYRTIKNYLKHILAYFNEQHTLILDPRTPPEVALKAETSLKNNFGKFYKMIINATDNCSDQMLSQLQTFIVDMLVESNASERPLSLRQQLFNQSCLALCKYRNNLLKHILAQQNPHEEHMADLERFTMEKLANQLHFQGRIFTTGAQFDYVVSNIEMKANRAIVAFKRDYHPEKYLLEGLGKAILGDDRSASHTALMQWAIEHYDLNNENAEETAMEPRISSNQPNNFSITEGGGVTPTATALLMEAAGLVVARPLTASAASHIAYEQTITRFTRLPSEQITPASIKKELNQLLPLFYEKNRSAVIRRPQAIALVLQDLCEALMVSGRNWIAEAEAITSHEAIDQYLASIMTTLKEERQQKMIRLAELLDPQDLELEVNRNIFINETDAEGNLLDDSQQMRRFFQSGLVKARQKHAGYTTAGRAANVAGNPNSVIIRGIDGVEEIVEGQLAETVGQATQQANRVIINLNGVDTEVNGEVLLYPANHPQAGQPQLNEQGQKRVRLFDTVLVWGTQQKLHIIQTRVDTDLNSAQSWTPNLFGSWSNAVQENKIALEKITSLEQEIVRLQNDIPQITQRLNNPPSIQTEAAQRCKAIGELLRAFASTQEAAKPRPVAIKAVVNRVKQMIINETA